MKQLQSSYNETRKTALQLLDNFKITKKVYDLITANFDYILLEPDPIKILHISSKLSFLHCPIFSNESNVKCLPILIPVLA